MLFEILRERCEYVSSNTHLKLLIKVSFAKLRWIDTDLQFFNNKKLFTEFEIIVYFRRGNRHNSEKYFLYYEMEQVIKTKQRYSP